MQRYCEQVTVIKNYISYICLPMWTHSEMVGYSPSFLPYGKENRTTFIFTILHDENNHTN